MFVRKEPATQLEQMKESNIDKKFVVSKCDKDTPEPLSSPSGGSYINHGQSGDSWKDGFEFMDNSQQIATVIFDRHEDDAECVCHVIPYTMGHQGNNNYSWNVNVKTGIRTVSSSLCPSRRRHATVVYVVAEHCSSEIYGIRIGQHEGITYVDCQPASKAEMDEFFDVPANKAVSASE